MEQWLTQTLESIINVHAIWGYIAIFLITFAESLAFIGLFVPGGIIVIVSGLGIAHGFLNPSLTVLAATLGAIAGDSLSYSLGKRSSTGALARLMKREHIESAEKFMQRYGSMSVLVARFVGVVRAIVPFVAGMVRMPVRTFMLWNVLSAIVWSISFILAGVLFGSVWRVLGAWTTRAGLLIFTLIGCVALLLWGMRVLARAIDILTPYWHGHHGKYIWRVLFWSALATTSILFLWCVYAVQAPVSTESLDVRVENLLILFRDPHLATFFVAVTMVGKDMFAILTVLILIALFEIYERRAYIAPLLLTVIGAITTSSIFKLLIARPRSLNAGYTEATYSFPSGHATIVLAIYGFLAFVLMRESTTWRRKVQHLAGATLLVGLVVFSRIYLGVHYALDVIAGLLISGFWIAIGIAWVRRTPIPRNSRKVRSQHRSITIVLCTIWVLAYAALIAWYRPEITFADAHRVRSTVPSEYLQNFITTQFAPEIESLLGDDRGSIQMAISAPSLSTLDGALKKLGWMRSDDVSLHSLTRMTGAQIRRERYEHAPVGYLFWNTLPQEVSYEQPMPQRWRSRERFILRLWHVPAQTTTGDTVYVAAIHQVTRTRIGGLLYQSVPATTAFVEHTAQQLISTDPTATVRLLIPNAELH